MAFLRDDCLELEAEIELTLSEAVYLCFPALTQCCAEPRCDTQCNAVLLKPAPGEYQLEFLLQL